MSQLLIMYRSILHMALLHYKDQSVTAVQELNSFFVAFAKQFRKPAVSLILSPSVCPSSWNSSIPATRMYVKINIGILTTNCRHHIWLKSDKYNKIYTRTTYFFVYFRY